MKRALAPFTAGFAAAWLVLVPAQDAEATSIPEIHFDVLAVHSDLAIEGTIRQRTSGFGANGHIETTYLIEAEQVWGTLSNEATYTLTLPGGEHQGLRTQVAGAPHFQVEQEVILLLQANAQGLVITGLERGAFSLVQDGDDPVVAERTQSVHSATVLQMDGSLSSNGESVENQLPAVELRRLLSLRFGPSHHTEPEASTPTVHEK